MLWFRLNMSVSADTYVCKAKTKQKKVSGTFSFAIF